MTEVSLHHLNKSYDGKTAVVNNFSLTIPSGQITALLGPSGCGKTTLLKMIAGLLEPTEGDIAFNGRSVLSIPAEKRSAVMVFQNHLLFPYMTVAENVGFGLRMRGEKQAAIADRVSEMLALVKLPGYEKRKPKELSGGQQQRVALARALIVEPEVLLLDEPLSNLDAHLRDEMRDLILGIQRKLGITTIMVTHDQEEAVILARNIAMIFEGELQQFGPPVDFYERPLSERVARFFGGVNFVPGEKQNNKMVTALGEFETIGCSKENGAHLLTIRPENVEILDQSAPNSFPARVLSRMYVGTHTRLKIQPETAVTQPIEIITDAAGIHTYQETQTVYIHFPPDKIWLLSN
ncbi:MAG: ABC transporter ATP-binding protein [Anaerolineae bacterium]|nr:ABC transporter ATP-binding protein [Anaerolineae bacterium]